MSKERSLSFNYHLKNGRTVITSKFYTKNNLILLAYLVSCDDDLSFKGSLTVTDG